jgi:hypothetical protein
MGFLNFLANKAFRLLFTWVMEQRATDTLCGTKVFRRSDYLRIQANSASSASSRGTLERCGNW